MRYLKYILVLLICVQFNKSIGQVITTHPRLFLDSLVINDLQTRRVANTTEWQRLKQRLDAYYTWTGAQIISNYIGQYEYIMTYALGYYATTDINYMNKAVDILMAFYNATTDATIQFDSGYNSRSYLFSMALGYDWCYNYMTSTQRTQIRNRIIVWTDWVIANGYAVWNSLYFEPGNNYSAGHLAGITSSAYAIYSENNVKGEEYRSHSHNTIADILPFMNSRLSGGDANEGWSYGSGYAMSVFYAYGIIKTASSDHYDYFQQTSWDNDVINFLIYATLPDRDHILPNGDWARESTGLIWDQHRTVADLISTFCDSQTQRGLACYWGIETYSSSSFHNFYVWRPFIFFNNEEQVIDYKTIFPFNTKYWVFTDSSGTGQFVQRTNWNNNAQWVSFRSGGMYGDHAHNGNGHFEIWENGWLIIDENITSSSGILIPDYAHNRVQLEPMSETWNLPSNPYNIAEHAEIPRREFTSYYSYIYENSLNVYQRQSNNTATKTERQFFYLPKQKSVFTYDIAATTSSSYYKKYRLHFPSAPTQNGNMLTYSNGISQVYGHTTYPINPSITIYNNTNNNYSVDIEYPSSEVKNYYFNMFYTRNSGSSAYTVNGISRDNSNVQISYLYGASVEISDTSYCVVFTSDNTSFTYDHLAYSVPLNNNIYIYCAGLQLSTTYYLKTTISSGNLNIDINRVNTGGTTSINTSSNGVLKTIYYGNPPPSRPKNVRIRK